MPNGSLDHLAFYVEVLLKLDELGVPLITIMLHDESLR